MLLCVNTYTHHIADYIFLAYILAIRCEWVHVFVNVDNIMFADVQVIGHPRQESLPAHNAKAGDGGVRGMGLA